MLKEWWIRLPNFLKNKYALTLLLFFAWLLFFDQHNIRSQVGLRSDVYQLQQDKAYYQQEIQDIKEDLEEILNDNKKLERFAREKYFMKRDHEEIFVLVEED